MFDIDKETLEKYYNNLKRSQAEHYPNETKKSIQKVKKFTKKHLVEIMNQCEVLDDRIKEIALGTRMQNIFSVDRYLKESTHIIEPRI